MILEIVKRTPLWVWPLFLALLYLGYAQSRTRPVGKVRLAILPVLMPLLSLAGVLSVFGASALALGGWLAALFAALFSVRAAGVPRGATWSAEARAFVIPGSWWPLALIMTIFFTRYGVNIALAMQPSLPKQAAFALLVGVLYGLPSGYFVGRALNVVRSANPVAAPA